MKKSTDFLLLWLSSTFMGISLASIICVPLIDGANVALTNKMFWVAWIINVYALLRYEK